jgi:hypothetical protein
MNAPVETKAIKAEASPKHDKISVFSESTCFSDVWVLCLEEDVDSPDYWQLFSDKNEIYSHVRQWYGKTEKYICFPVQITRPTRLHAGTMERPGLTTLIEETY